VRIGLIAPPWLPVPPAAYGGTELVLDVLARGLAKAGHDVLLVTTGDSTCPVRRSWAYDRARTAEIGNTTVEVRHLIHAYSAVRDMDIVHDHTVVGPVVAAARDARNVVTTNHGPFTADVTEIYRSIGARIPLIAISHHQASTSGGVPTARVIHHGLDVARYPVGAGTGGYALFLGRMSPSKGVTTAIQVARRAGLPLIIAAKMQEPAEREYFDSDVAPMLGRDVSYIGEVGGSEKLSLLGNAVALLNPILWDEPFGLCMIEALACGTPVVATCRGSVPEIVDHTYTGFVCSSVDELAKAMAQAGALDRRACRAAVEARFSMEEMARNHIALYEDVVSAVSGEGALGGGPAKRGRPVPSASFL